MPDPEPAGRGLIRHAVFFALVACGGRTELAGDTAGGDASTIDVPIADVSIDQRTCDPNAPFTKITPLPFNTELDEYDVRFTPDELTAYFIHQRDANGGESDVWSARRASISSTFSTPTLLPGLAHPNAGADAPNPTPDNLDLAFEGACKVSFDSPPVLCGAHRDSADAAFGAPFIIDFDQNSTTYRFAGLPYTIHAGGVVYVQATPPGPFANAFGRGARVDATRFGPIERVQIDGVPQVSAFVSAPVVSEDEKTIYFVDVDVASQNAYAWSAMRSDTTKPFAGAHLIPELPINMNPNWISPDGCRLYFTQVFSMDASFQQDLFVAER